MLRPWFSLLIAQFVLAAVQCANILGLFLMHTGSHFQISRPLLERLADRGHQVDVLSHFPRKTPLPGYFDYSVQESVPPLTNLPIEYVKSMTTIQGVGVMNYCCGKNLCEAVMNTTAAKELKKSGNKYDAIITELFVSDCLLGFAHLFKAPIIAITTTVNLPWASDLIGLPDNPSYIPNYFSLFTPVMNFLERLQNAITLQVVKVYHKYYPLEESNKFIEETFSATAQHVSNLRKNISLLMVNSHFSVQQSRPMTANFIEIGGIHIKPNPVLPKDYEAYLETDLQGVAYVSFGSMFKSETFPDNILVPLFEALREIPYKILWKGERSHVSNHLNVPKNIQFVPWLPQLELLCHPNLRFFVSHCGLASIQETIYCGKPILAIPVWVDQLSNADAAVSKGIGLSVPLFQVTKQKMSDALIDLLGNTRYGMSAKRASEEFRDRPMAPLDTAVYWTEYVIRRKGAPQLRSKAADLPWHKYYCLDIIVIHILVLLIAFALIYHLLTLLLRRVASYAWNKLLISMSKSKSQ